MVEYNNNVLTESYIERIYKWKSDLKISIYSLFGDKDIHLNFDEPIKIFVGENGIGKTTILNIMYYLLINDFEKLKEINFDSIEITTKDQAARISQSDLIIHCREDANNLLNKFRRYLSEEERYFLLQEIISGDKDIGEFIEKYGDSIKERTRFSRRILEDIVEFSQMNMSSNEIEENISKIQTILKDIFKGKVMYFPTYRRIEEDLHKIGYILKENGEVNSRLSDKHELIKFGMDDVDKLFENITSEIIQSAIEGLKIVTSEMLTQLVNNNVNDITSEIKRIMKQKDAINVVLERVKSELPAETSKRLKEIVLDKNFNEGGVYNEFLLYFLHNFIKIYEKSAYKEVSIRQFMTVCNKYLVDKEVRYDEGAVKIGIFRKSNDSIVKLSHLSSGEKQIVSIFAKLYLTNIQDFVILFDEPELSLSLKWQKMFLIDILNSNKCSFIFSVTHSPFIYQNELKTFAYPLELLLGEESINE